MSGTAGTDERRIEDRAVCCVSEAPRRYHLSGRSTHTARMVVDSDRPSVTGPASTVSTCRACSRNRNFNDGRGLASSRTSCPDVCDENAAWAPTNDIADAGYCSPAVARRGGWPAKCLWRPTDSCEHCDGSGSARADARYCSRPCNRRTYARRRSKQQPAVK